MFQNLSGFIICFLHIKFCLFVGETCGLPWANTVRPYRALGKLPYENHPLGGYFYGMHRPFLPRIDMEQAGTRPAEKEAYDGLLSYRAAEQRGH